MIIITIVVLLPLRSVVESSKSNCNSSWSSNSGCNIISSSSNNGITVKHDYHCHQKGRRKEKNLSVETPVGIPWYRVPPASWGHLPWESKRRSPNPDTERTEWTRQAPPARSTLGSFREPFLRERIRIRICLWFVWR